MKLTRCHPPGKVRYMSKTKQVQITIRIPPEWVTRLDAIARAMSLPGVEANRALAMRHVVANGLEPTEMRLGLRSHHTAL